MGWRAEGPAGDGWLRRRDDSGQNSIQPHSSGRLEPLDFRLELKTQLCALVIGQPVRHLRKNGSVKKHRLRPTAASAPHGLRPEFLESGTHGVRICAVIGRGCILADQIGLKRSGWREESYLHRRALDRKSNSNAGAQTAGRPCSIPAMPSSSSSSADPHRYQFESRAPRHFAIFHA